MTPEQLDRAIAGLAPLPAAAHVEVPKLSPTADILPKLALAKAVHDAENAERERRRKKANEERRARIDAEQRSLEPRLHHRLLAALRTHRSPTMLLLGPTGTGKTAGLYWLKALFGGEIVHAREIGEAEKWHPLGVGEPPLRQKACQTRLLGLDDVGAEDAVHVSAIQYTIERRYRAGLPTAIATGLTRRELTLALAPPTCGASWNSTCSAETASGP